MKSNHALVLGASGLIGSELLALLIADPDFSKVTLLLRKPLEVKDAKVIQHVVDFGQAESWRDKFENVDLVFCAVGTTRNKTPNLVDYRKVDYDIPMHAIAFSESAQVEKFMLVSSVGADAKSKNFYLKIKGEVEDVLEKAQIPVRGVFQPSLLLGKRKEKRFGENLARIIMPVFNFLIPTKYKAIQADCVANAMVVASKIQQENTRTYLYKDMNSHI